MSKQIILTPKRSKISAGHSLQCFGPDHPCAQPHGHTWWVQASFAGVPVDGLLIGYEVVHEVVSRFDYSNLDTNPVMQGLMASGENMLIRLVELFEQRCQDRSLEADTLDAIVQLVRVELTEDPIPGDAHSLVWVREGWEWFRP